VASIARGTVDTALNAGVILFTGVLILVFMVAAILGHDLRRSAIDALLYKNWFWWGLDLVADGLVLIYVAGAWYLLATLITGKKLFMENVARAAEVACLGAVGDVTAVLVDHPPGTIAEGGQPVCPIVPTHPRPSGQAQLPLTHLRLAHLDLPFTIATKLTNAIVRLPESAEQCVHAKRRKR
jgi:hypothetical protein